MADKTSATESLATAPASIVDQGKQNFETFDVESSDDDDDVIIIDQQSTPSVTSSCMYFNTIFNPRISGFFYTI